MGCRRKNNLFIYENQFEDGRIFCHKCSSCYCSCPKFRFSSTRTPDNLKPCSDSDHNSNSLRDLSLNLRSTEKSTRTALPELKFESYQKSVISPPRKYSSSSSNYEASSSTYSNDADTSPMYCSTFSSRSTPTSLYSSPSKSSTSSYQRLSPNRTTTQYLTLSPISPVKSTPSSRCCSPLDYFSSPIYPPELSPDYCSSTNFDYSPLEYPLSSQLNNNKPKSPFLDRSPTVSSPFNPNYSDFSPLSPESAHTFSPLTDHKKTYFNFDKLQHYRYSSLSPTHSPFAGSTFKGRHLPRSAPCKYCTLSPRTYF